MKFGVRIPNIKMRISARFSVARVIRHSVGIKAPNDMGIITNPRKYFYNKIYHRLTFDAFGGRVGKIGDRYEDDLFDGIEKSEGFLRDKAVNLIDDGSYHTPILEVARSLRDKAVNLIDEAIDLICEKKEVLEAYSTAGDSDLEEKIALFDEAVDLLKERISIVENEDLYEDSDHFETLNLIDEIVDSISETFSSIEDRYSDEGLKLHEDGDIEN